VEEVAKYFKRTSSSVSHTCTKIEDLLECDRDMGAIIKLVGKKIRGKE
jgi:chromosomal replication initiation ATPase DnaA